MFESWIGNAKIIRATYRPEHHTYEVEYLPEGSPVNHVNLLTKDFFPNHQGIAMLDETVKIHETVKVILKGEKELEYLGYKLDEKKKKMLAHPSSKFLIGKKKKQMLGNVYNARVGITEQFEPYVFIDRYRFSLNEIKCVLKDADLKISPEQRNVQVATKSGTYKYDAERRYLQLPNNVFDVNAISDLIKFMRKANLA